MVEETHLQTQNNTKCLKEIIVKLELEKLKYERENILMKESLEVMKPQIQNLIKENTKLKKNYLQIKNKLAHLHTECKSISDKYALLQHEKINVSDPVDKTVCEFTNCVPDSNKDVIDNVEKLNNHRSSSCSTVGSSSNASHLINAFQYNSSDVSFECYRCKKSFVQQIRMLTHVKNSICDRAMCKICHKIFCTRAYLKVHLSKHARNNYLSRGASYKKNQLKCREPHSGKQFPTNFLFQKHRLVHTGVKRPFVCPKILCEKRFNQRANLHKHMYVHNRQNYVRNKFMKRSANDNENRFDCIEQDEKTYQADQQKQSSDIEFVADVPTSIIKFNRADILEAYKRIAQENQETVIILD